MTAAGDTVAFVAAAHRLLGDQIERDALALRGEATYRERFSLDRTLEVLRGVAAPAAARP
jgi:hypothetical protein